MNALTAPPAATDDAPGPTAPAAGHAVSLLLTGADDGLLKVMTVLRSRRWAVRSLQVDLSGEVGRVDLVVAHDGRAAELLLEQLRRVVVVVRAEPGVSPAG
ncbi:ACT domain-containing protein [Pseudonocardia spirodelae]|uniref:ACT domain-containing protein n=1 Tax=Pseudonocardia spirodelae TaxID=3133431 RepID=A0ABU8TBH3_9PSEU